MSWRRKSCKQPEIAPCIAAGKRGPCRLCSDMSNISARMKAMYADPEFAARRDAKASARMKAMHADPEFAAKVSARMKAMNADPEFAAKASARMKAMHANRMSWCGPALIEDYRLLVRQLGATEARRVIELQMASGHNEQAEARA